MADTTQDAPKTDTPPAAETGKPNEAGAAAASDAKHGAPSKGAAAADAAKNAAKAGLQVFQKLGSGAGKKVFGTIKSILSLPLLVFQGDFNTRLLTLGFIASLGLIILAGVKLYDRFMPKASQSESMAGSGMKKYFEEQKELAIATANLVYLDKFSASIDAKHQGVKVYEFELFIENDSPETSGVVKSNLERFREFVAGAMQGQNYDDLITPEGKEKFKKHLTEALNRGLRQLSKKGSIKKIYFTRFVMG